MIWSDYVIIAWLCLGAVLSVGLVGKPRTPVTPGAANVGILITALLVFMIIATHA